MSQIVWTSERGWHEGPPARTARENGHIVSRAIHPDFAGIPQDVREAATAGGYGECDDKECDRIARYWSEPFKAPGSYTWRRVRLCGFHVPVI